MNVKILGRLLLLLFGFALVVPASAQTAPVANPDASLAEGYVLGSGDMLEISVLGREDYRARVQVQTDGTIELPLVGSVTAARKTALQLREDIRGRLKSGGYFANPVVNIAIVTYASRYVVVLGEVAAPGIVPIDRAYRVSEILARVGGTKESGADSLMITRQSGEEIKLNIREIAMGAGEKDPFVNAGDKIFVAAAPTFYVYGQVNAPGNYRIDAEMTLRKAIARSGGLTPMGSTKRAKVTRAGQEVRVGLDDPIKDKDVIVVGQKFF